MDLDDLTSVLGQTGADVWDLIEGAITLAARDHMKELTARRMGIIERLVLATTTATATPREEEVRRSGAGERGTVRNNGRAVEETGGGGAREWKSRGSPSTPQSMQREEDEDEEEGEEREHEEEPDADEDDEKTRILAIREHIEDPEEDEDTLITLLQNLLDMDISFISLRDTDIGRHVNNLRKHPSTEVRRIVKLLVRKWKDIVADWAKFNIETGSSAVAASIITDGDSPQQFPAKSSSMNGYHPSDHGYSPNPHYGMPSSEKPSREPEPSRQKAPSAPRRELSAPARPSIPQASTVQSAKAKEQKDSLMDPERLASARKRLHENYQEIQNAKKQRTVQALDINDIPRKKNTFIPRGKQQGKHW